MIFKWRVGVKIVPYISKRGIGDGFNEYDTRECGYRTQLVFFQDEHRAKQFEESDSFMTWMAGWQEIELNDDFVKEGLDIFEWKMDQ